MSSVTRDKKKYGAPSIYSEKKREKERIEQREKDLQDQLSKDYDSGRFDGARRLPIISDD